MPDHDVERALADCLEAAVRSHLGIALTGREEHDGPPPRLRVDFTYSTPPPGAALEITDVAWPHWRAANSMRDTIADELNTLAQEEELGGWIASIGARLRMRDLGPEIADLMRQGTEIDTARLRRSAIEAAYRADDETYTELMALTDRYHAAGLNSLQRTSADDHGFGVCRLGSSIQTVRDSYGPLIDRIDDNADKLDEARQGDPARTTHLLVRVTDGRVSRHDLGSLPPLLPDAIDYLWLILRVRPDDEAQGLWIRRGDAAWSTFAEQLGPLPDLPE